MKYILLTLAITLLMAVSSCGHEKVELPSDDTGTDAVDSDTTVNETTAEATTVTGTTESSDIPEITSETEITTTETISTQEPEFVDDNTTEDSNTSEKTYIKPDPLKFAYDLSMAYWRSEEVVMYYDNGTNQVKFELAITDDDERPRLKINDNPVNFSVAHDDGGYFGKVYVADEFIVVLSSVTGSDSGSAVYIFNYSGNILFQTYYLTNTCIAAYSIVSVDNDKIVLYGTKMSSANDIVFRTYDYDNDMFADWSEYLCECPVYEYEFDSIFYDKSSLDQLSKVNKDDIVSAKFEMDYLGNGRFGKLKMLPGESRISDIIEGLTQQS